MEMIRITNKRDSITLTIPQYMLGLHVVCWVDGKYRQEALALDQALHRDDRDTAREILDGYGYEIDFYEVEDNEQ